MELIIKGHKVLIDDEDLYLFNQYKWRIVKNKSRSYYIQGYKLGDFHSGGDRRGTGYDDSLEKRGPDITLHRLIMSAPDGVEVDHENHNGLDCQKYNLRFITRSGNGRNWKRKPRKDGCPQGVSKSGNRYRARMKIMGKMYHLGTFDTIGEASQVYEAACTNQIEKETL